MISICIAGGPAFAGDPPPPAEPPPDTSPPPSDTPDTAPDTAPPDTAPPDSPPPEKASEPNPDEISDEELAKLLAEQDAEAVEEVIVVTGSTIARRSLTTPAPLTVLDRELLLAAGRATLGEVLQGMPVVTGGQTAQTNANSEGAVRIDLRGLGAARTLGLINGRRVVPSSSRGANLSLDYNMIPLSLIDRVEVLKDGASAVYGADAIGGVVNVITRNDFEGSEVSLYTGESSQLDGLAYEASFLTGHNSESKKGNIVFAAGVQTQEPIFARDRAFSSVNRTYDFVNRTESVAGSTATPGGRIDTRRFDMDGDGRPDPTPVALCGVGQQFCTRDGNGFRPFDPATDLYNTSEENYIYTPASRYHVFSTGTYKLRPSIQTFFEAAYVNRKSEQQTAADTLVNIPVSGASIYNPLGGTLLGLQRRLEELGPKRNNQNVDNFRLVVGLKGSVPDDAPVLANFKWELSLNFGRNDFEETNHNGVVVSRLRNAVGPSFIDGQGVARCGTPTAIIPNCVPMDVLGPPGSISKEAASYVTYSGIRTGYSEQAIVLAQTSGQLVKLPNNGDISLAFGGDFRAESGGITPNPVIALGDTTEIIVPRTDGEYNVVAGYAEVSIVPVSNKPGARWLELSGAARGVHYDTFGSAVTWKAGALYRPISVVAVRGTYSTAFRAPSITDLYQGDLILNLPGIADPCDTRPGAMMIELDPATAEECARQGVPANAAFGSALQQTRLVTRGNDKLDPERATIQTAGIVIEPMRGVSLTADYWRYDIRKAIRGLETLGVGPTSIFNLCYRFHVQAYCDQIHRNPDSTIAFVDNPYANLGTLAGSGIDVSLAVDRELGVAGRFRQQLDSQYLLRLNSDDGEHVTSGVGNTSLAFPRPQLTVGFTSIWQHPLGFGGGFSVRYLGSFDECEIDCALATTKPREVAAYYKTDVFASHTVKSRAGVTTISVGVSNVFDRKPPRIYTSADDSSPSSYDYRGRYFYARMAQQF